MFICEALVGKFPPQVTSLLVWYSQGSRVCAKLDRAAFSVVLCLTENVLKPQRHASIRQPFSGSWGTSLFGSGAWVPVTGAFTLYLS